VVSATDPYMMCDVPWSIQYMDFGRFAPIGVFLANCLLAKTVQTEVNSKAIILRHVC
jgi:hypothetical protein